MHSIIVFGGSGFVVTDFVIVAVIAGLSLKVGKAKWFGARNAPFYLYLLWALFIPPLIIGVILHNNVLTVARDARVLVYYWMMFPLYSLFSENDAAVQLFLRKILYFRMYGFGIIVMKTLCLRVSIFMSVAEKQLPW